MRPSVAVVVSTLLFSLGCTRWGFEREQAVGVHDAPTPLSDTGLPDGVVRADTRRDGALPLRDGPRDTNMAGDVASEQAPAFDSASTIDGPTDIAPTIDGPTIDGPTIDGPTIACAQGAPIFTFPGSRMVICRWNNGAVTQCEAARVCDSSAGWQLCTASQFLARGGATTPSMAWAWIAGCIREGPQPFAPVDRVCDSCAGGTSNMRLLSWNCATGADYGSADATYIGLTTSTNCLRPGENSPAWNGYWTTTSSRGGTTSAVCCD